MTGKRHHYVPRFLQAGFNSRPGERARRAWLYRKGEATPLEVTLKHISVEVSFYRYRAPGVDISADEAITRAEGQRLAPLVQKLRTGNPTSILDPAALAELFAHIYARTKALWEIGRLQAPLMFERLATFTRDPQAIQSVLPRLLETQRPIVTRLLASRYPDRDVGELLSEWGEQIQGVASEELSADIGRISDALLGWALRALQVSKVQSMQELSKNPELAKRFHGRTFRLLELDGARFVQGDTPVVFYRAGGFTPILAKDESFDYAFLPVTPMRVVVACVRDIPHSWEELRDASIACSHEHFIAAAQYPDLATLASTIGRNFSTVTGGDIEKLFAEAVALASTPNWMGAEEEAIIEHLAHEVLWPPEDGGVAPSGG